MDSGRFLGTSSRARGAALNKGWCCIGSGQKKDESCTSEVPAASKWHGRDGEWSVHLEYQRWQPVDLEKSHD